MPQALAGRRFEPGTTGWTVDHLYDPFIQSHWSQGRYELVDGVLAMMAPQGFRGVRPLTRLRELLAAHLRRTGQTASFYHEVDLLLRAGRIARPDMIVLTPEQERRQEEVERERGLVAADDYCPIFVPPLLVVESLSPSHEAHDRRTKRDWYAEAGVPHYWLLTAHERSLVCLKLGDDVGEAGASPTYVEESAGTEGETIQSSAFGGVTIHLADVWATP